MEMSDLFEEFATIINSREYWRFAGQGKLRKGVKAMQKALRKNPSMESIIKVAKEWQEATFFYDSSRYLNRHPYFRKLCKAITCDNPEDAILILKDIKKSIKGFLKKKRARDLKNLILNSREQLAVMEHDKHYDKLSGQIANFYFELGILLEELKDQKEGYEAFVQSINFSQTVELRCRAHFGAGFIIKTTNSQKKLEHFREATILAQSCDLPVIEKSRLFFQCGQELEALGRESEAICYYCIALEIRPDYARAKTKLTTFARNKKEGRERQAIEELIDYNSTILHAARNGDVHFVKYLLSQKKAWGHVQDENGNTALHIAAMHGQIELFDDLAASLRDFEGDSFSATGYGPLNKEGLTPLLAAVKTGQVAAVTALLDKGAHIVVQKHNALKLAIQHGQVEIITMLHNNELHWSRLVRGRHGKVDILAFAIEKSEDPKVLEAVISYCRDSINELSTEGNAAIHLAVNEGNRAAIRILCRARANLNAKSKARFSALELAQRRNDDLADFIVNLQQSQKEREEYIVQNKSRLVKAILEEMQQQPEWQQALKAKSKMFCENIEQALNSVQCLNLLEKATFYSSPDFMKLKNVIVENLVAEQDNIIKENRGMIYSSLDFDKNHFMKTLEAAILSPWQQTVDDQLSSKNDKEYYENKSLVEKQQLFCACFEERIDKAFSYFAALNSGDAVSAQYHNEQGMAYRLQNALQSTPKIGPLISVAVKAVVYARNTYTIAEARNMVSWFAHFTPYERAVFVKNAGQWLAEKYANQINQLMPSSKGVELFAECAAVRIIKYLTNEHANDANKPSMLEKICSVFFSSQTPVVEQRNAILINIFSEAINTATSDGIIFKGNSIPQESDPLRLAFHSDETWNSREIFENTGIVTAEGDHYGNNSSKLNIYGYCFGTKKEVKKRNLAPVNSAGESCPEGHRWSLEPTRAPSTPQFASYRTNNSINSSSSAPTTAPQL